MFCHCLELNESFPRMWDQRVILSDTEQTGRIIPTYVGSTVHNRGTRPSTPNHSHVCGINSSIGIIHDCISESFPRMWDQPKQIRCACLYIRIIPTYVGSTPPRSSTPSSSPNHSHVCGINASMGLFSVLSNESFPRMWDQRKHLLINCLVLRIIPTYVGSTRTNHPRNCRDTNHSHVCGINPFLSQSMYIVVESFPRMWDQRAPHPRRRPRGRIIPTYVGSTLHPRISDCYRPNHSHVCGINDTYQCYSCQ